MAGLSGTAVAAIIIAALAWWSAVGIWHGVKKVGHGAKVVACAIHMPSVKCQKPETGK